jgi:uroporphyrinogen decarboxylase
MNSLERLIASGEGQFVDCVPVCPGIGHYAAYQARQPMTKVAFDPELMASVVLAALRRHGYDACSPITDYGLGTENMGSQVVIREWEQTYVSDFPIKSSGDIARLHLPDPLKDGRMPVIIGCERLLTATVGETTGVNGGLAGPLSFASNLRGLDRLMVDVVTDRQLVHRLLQVSLEAVKDFGEAQVVHGQVTTVNIYDPVATLLSTPMAEEFCFVYLEDLIGHLKARGAKILLHICGDTKRLLEGMLRIGVDVISLDVDVDMREAKSMVAGRATISGNVATQNLFRHTHEEIYAEACNCIEKAAGGGRFSLSSSCEVPLETPPENIDAMVRAAREFGAEHLRRLEASGAGAGGK